MLFCVNKHCSTVASLIGLGHLKQYYNNFCCSGCMSTRTTLIVISSEDDEEKFRGDQGMRNEFLNICM